MIKPRPLLYRNADYGFTLQLPHWWKPFCIVRHTAGHGAFEAEIQFLFRYKGRGYGPIFTLFVLRMTREEWRREGYDDSPLQLLAAHGGRLFAYSTPEELPEAFLDKKTGDYDYKRYGRPIGLLKRMVNKDVPRLVRTLRFVSRSPALRSKPWLSRSARCKRCLTP